MFERTIVFGCAGKGSRLGLGTTKALVDIAGKPLIIRNLDLLKNEKNIRIVVGYKAQELIDVVSAYRKDITYVYNYEYEQTKTGDSVALAAKDVEGYILSIDGDLLVHPDDMKKILQAEYEFVGGGTIESDDPWMVQTYMDDGCEKVKGFSKEEGQHEWNGVVQIEAGKIATGKGHVFQCVEPFLPLRYMDLRTREVDTMGDYKRAIKWIENGYK